MRLNLDSFIINSFIFYLIIKPLYILPGLPFQLADILLVLNFIFLFVTKYSCVNKVRVKHVVNMLNIYLIITFYQLLINVVAYIDVSSSTLESFSLLRNNLYYLFNFFTMLYTYRLFQIYKERIFLAFITGSFYSMLLVLIGLLITFGKTSRNMSFFTNPNQLGYYALVMLTGIFILDRYCSKFKKNVILIISIISLLVSGSKAAIIGGVILFVLLFVRWLLKDIASGNWYRISLKKATPIILILTLFTATFKRVLLLFTNYIDSFSRRLDTLTFSTSTLGDSRGYSRIGEIGVNVIQGVGEGAFFRFSVMSGNETHSSFATILVSYGLIGALLYVLLFWHIVCRNLKNILPFLVLFIGILFYWASHNGLRNSIFWILIVFFAISYSGVLDQGHCNAKQRS